MADRSGFEEWYRADYRRVLVALVAVAGGVELGCEATDEPIRSILASVRAPG